jgi:hypothetical protein
MMAAAPVIMSIEQMPQVAEGYNQQSPQMVPVCFVAAPEFCAGMWVPPLGGCEVMWPQSAPRGQFNPVQDRRNRGNQSNRNWAGRPARRGQQEASAPQQNVNGREPWADSNSNTDGPVQVELSNLPKMLCSRACLEASLEQAGLASHVQSIEFEKGAIGKAVLVLGSHRAALRCVQHYNGLQWGKSSAPVSARIAPEEHQKSQQPSTEVKVAAKSVPKAKTSKPKLDKDNDSCCTTPVGSPLKSPMKSPIFSAMTSPTLSYASSKRWSDYATDSEDDEDDDQSKSTRAGTLESQDSD